MKFTEEHEWLDEDGELMIVGITEHAATQLGDLVFVQLPEVGASLSKGDSAVIVESVKAASDVYAPVDGTVTAANSALDADPAMVNSAAEGDGWLWKMELADSSQLDGLMDEAAYKAMIG